MAIEFKSNISNFESVSQSRDIFASTFSLQDAVTALGHQISDVRIRETNKSLKVGKYNIALGKSLRQNSWQQTAEVVRQKVNTLMVGELEVDEGFLLVAYVPGTGGNQASHALFNEAEEEAADSHAVDADAVAS